MRSKFQEEPASKRNVRAAAWMWVVLGLAIFYGVVSAAPLLAFRAHLGSEFRGVDRVFNDDELHYTARIQDVLDGNPLLSNAYLWEHKRGVSLQLFLGEVLLAQPLKLLGLRAAQGRILYCFVLPPVVFLMTFLSFRRVVGRSSWAIVFSVGMLFGVFIGSFTRPVSPQFNFIFWLAQFLLVWRLVTRTGQRRWTVLNAVGLGFLFYIYPFYWTHFLTLYGLLFLWGLRYDRRLAGRIVALVCAGLLFGSYYIYQTYQAMTLPEYSDTLVRHGVISSRWPTGIFVTTIAMASVGMLLCSRWFGITKMGRRWVLLTLSLVAAFLSTQQHIITGKLTVSSSHNLMHTALLGAFACAFVVRALLLRKGMQGRIARLITGGACALAVAICAGGYGRAAVEIRQRDRAAQRYAPVLNWLRAHAAPEDVVFANPELSSYIPAYTPQNVFHCDEASRYYISKQEVFERFVLNHIFEDFDEKMVRANERAVFGWQFINRHAHLKNRHRVLRIVGGDPSTVERYPRKEIDAFLRYAAELKSGSWRERLDGYRLDFIVWDKRKDPLWEVHRLGNLEKRFENEDYVIYEVTGRGVDSLRERAGKVPGQDSVSDPP